MLLILLNIVILTVMDKLMLTKSIYVSLKSKMLGEQKIVENVNHFIVLLMDQLSLFQNVQLLGTVLIFNLSLKVSSIIMILMKITVSISKMKSITNIGYYSNKIVISMVIVLLTLVNYTHVL